MSGKRARDKRKRTGDEITQATQKNKQLAGTCIFCQRSGDMSKQHIWPEWMQKIVEDFQPKTSHTTLGWFPEVDSYYNKKISNGRPGAQRIRKVCSKCNGGWINNEVEAMMRPIFTDIIQHNTNSISTENQFYLALWAVLATMVYEFKDPITMATSQLERDYLYNTKQIPDRRQVWIGRMNADPKYTQYIAHRGIKLSNSNDIKSENLTCNTSCTVFAVNELVIVVGKIPTFVQVFPFLGEVGGKLMPIYPTYKEQVRFDKLSILTSNEVNEIRNSFTSELNQYI
ncbi:hypothetical protein [Runella slithyformis]|uniref:HNH endonuclease n=1 Tax=Runella slithyformis (strain ATCC 29530 / DSM 19594 / LMG 11500 / NCIMB 11436 / LSU 4) TaxID=761193 RepID=A0A7U3ZG43_RUNSL|nr:hypothetical protein [Runella slithyformis]AEI46550.1 hypothetical protein Runsl_0091 [Runella slithyformis DSM 19594]